MTMFSFFFLTFFYSMFSLGSSLTVKPSPVCQFGQARWTTCLAFQHDQDACSRTSSKRSPTSLKNRQNVFDLCRLVWQEKAFSRCLHDRSQCMKEMCSRSNYFISFHKLHSSDTCEKKWRTLTVLIRPFPLGEKGSSLCYTPCICSIHQGRSGFPQIKARWPIACRLLRWIKIETLTRRTFLGPVGKKKSSKGHARTQ